MHPFTTSEFNSLPAVLVLIIPVQALAGPPRLSNGQGQNRTADTGIFSPDHAIQ
jgi:hypothetical protein